MSFQPIEKSFQLHFFVLCSLFFNVPELLLLPFGTAVGFKVEFVAEWVGGEGRYENVGEVKSLGFGEGVRVRI